MELFTWWDDADWIVRGVFVTLIVLSLVSWSIMLHKGFHFTMLMAGENKGRGLGHRMVQEVQPQTEDDVLLNLRIMRMSQESGLTVLATIGNTAPFIGLFGTVWGIMHALQGLSSAEALSMDLVAGPVAEALVATAVGLFVAIPAVAGYNLLIRRLRVLCLKWETTMIAAVKQGQA